MTYQVVLVHSDASEEARSRLRVALGLARRFRAVLAAVYVGEPLVTPGLLDAARSMDAVYASHDKAVKEDRRKARAIFDEAIEGQSINAAWCSVEGLVERELGLHARYADLAVVSQGEVTAGSLSAGLPEAVALVSGRGVVVVPRGATSGDVGRHVLLCWNGSREVSRAAWDALPILKMADKVTVFIVEPVKTEGYGVQLGTDAAIWLGRHGVKAQLERRTETRGDAGEAILAYAADHGVDLIVMGLYGHSRAREFVLGGASRTILTSARCALFITH